MTHESFDEWKRIADPILTPDGQWVVYNVISLSGDTELVVRGTETEVEYRVARGRISSSGRNAAKITTQAVQVTADSRSILFTMVAEKAVDRNGMLSTHNMAVAILSLPEGNVRVIESASAFMLLPEGSNYVLLTTDEYVLRNYSGIYQSSVRDADAAHAHEESELDTAISLLDLFSGRLVAMPNISSFSFDRRGRYLAYAESSNSGDVRGIYVRDLHSDVVTAVLTGKGNYRDLVFDQSGTQLAFLHAYDDSILGQLQYSIYYTNLTNGGVEKMLSADLFAPGRYILANSGLDFSIDGSALTFEIGQINSTIPADGRRSLELWHWKDPRIQPHQKVLTENYPVKSQSAVFHLREKRLVELTSDTVPYVQLSNNARYAIGFNQAPYMDQDTWGEFIADIYLIDAMTSAPPTLLRRAFQSSEGLPSEYWEGSPVRVSPTSRYLMYFEGGRWFSYDLSHGTEIDLTGRLLPDIRFELDLSYAVNRPARPVGVVAWTRSDQRVLIYSQHDIWEFDPAGMAAPRNLTNGVGRRDNLVFRVWQSSASQGEASKQETPIIDADEPLLLTAYDLDTMATGVWRVRMDSPSSLTPLIMDDKKVKLLDHVDHHKYLLTQESYNEFPDLWFGSMFDQLEKISDVNPQHQEYEWGSEELVTWTSDFGVPLKGVLYKPSGFDPSKVYPLVVNIYSLMSQSLHSYLPPAPSYAATLTSPAVNLGKGYLVFRPDIINVTPYPGESAKASVVSGVRSLVERGFVDSSRICLIGHSWGGYETAYIAAHSRMFRCAVMGAGHTDTISAYSNIGSNGRVDSFAYEHGIAYHGSSIWENPFLYVANSPMMFADDVQTPILMLHNRGDSVVPFSQAIEFYIALRRNKKEVYLISYNGEGHSISSYDNRLDWDGRMQQFLDFFLKGSAEPIWMRDGEPRERGQ